MPTPSKSLILPVLVAALGYFVDIYDLLIFSVVRVASLKSLGLEGEALTQTGLTILNAQMAGMLLGGVLWGMMGDRKGRLSTLFGSILLYSLASLACAFVQTVPQYVLARFIAGIGLAGELGAGVILVAELLPRGKRGIGTMIVAAVGVTGGIAASLAGKMLDWQTAYIVGGVMGLSLFVLRLGVMESALFTAMAKQSGGRQGDLLLLLGNAARAGRYLSCILIGLPLWFVVGLIVTFAPEIGRALGIAGEVQTPIAVLCSCAGQPVGDLACGLLSQRLRSRRKALCAFLAAGFLVTAAILTLPSTPLQYYALVCAAGFTLGFWAVFVTVTAEIFGTNLRATAATSAPNIVRGAIIPVAAAFGVMKEPLGVLPALHILSALIFGMALLAAWRLKETFDKDLDYTEQ